MTTYDSLTAQEKEDFSEYDKFMRGVASSLTRLARTADPSTWNQFAVDYIDTALAALDDNEVIPNSTNLAGARDLTVSEWRILQGLLRTLTGTQTTHKALLVKAAGVNGGD